MGKRGKEIVGVDLGELLKLLNKALADEWLAYYQYWTGAKVAKGRMRGIVAAELEEHAKEELEHAEKLSERILQLGGTPILEPKEWYDQTNCNYEVPSNPDTKVLVKQNIDGERCAIDVYKKLLDFISGKDAVTSDLVLGILSDEVVHEEDLEAILEDMEAPLQ